MTKDEIEVLTGSAVDPWNPYDHPERRPGEVFLDAGNVALPGERLGSLARTTEDGVPLYWTFGSARTMTKETEALVKDAQTTIQRLLNLENPTATDIIWLKRARHNLVYAQQQRMYLKVLAQKDAEAGQRGGETS